MISRRAMGLGLLGVSALVTTGVVVTRSYPQLLTSVGIGQGEAVAGFVGGEKAAFLQDPQVVALLSRQAGATPTATIAGGVEQCRDPALLGRHPSFLWPGSDILTDLARHSGAAVRAGQVLFRSPLVLHSWASVAEALVSARLASVEGGVTYVDLSAFIAALGQPESGEDAAPRLKSADPYTSASGMQFAGLLANVLVGDVATAETLRPQQAKLLRIFARMGRKPANAKQLFDEYIAAGPQAAPLVVGYESQHLEWLLADPARAALPPERRPVMLYLRPTIMTAHTFISLSEDGDRLLSGLQRPEVLALGWSAHGLRGAAGAVGAGAAPAVTGRFAASLPAVLPLQPGAF